MKIENQVCTWRQAKKLKELGIEQKTFWYWLLTLNNMGYLGSRHANISQIESYMDDEKFSAFTVAELGIMLPPVNIAKGEFMHFCKGVNGGWSVDYSGEDAPGLPEEYDTGFNLTEAEARANMLIYLLEKKIIQVEEVNNRLNNSI